MIVLVPAFQNQPFTDPQVFDAAIPVDHLHGLPGTINSGKT